ncbi:MAG: hypothetical protein CL868_05890 [Cytophagaceae bacterium]|nr:hypothetical protein [Cytophagaceae bacterium]|tara:strand:- start:16935 stop:17810 length:876 start_codon:yes stop_codon:yes gene_type:complete
MPRNFTFDASIKVVMKHLLLSLFLAVLLVGCADDIPVNTAVMQGTKDSVFWKASAGRAQILEDGRVRFTGFRGDERLELTISQNSVGTFPLEEDGINLAEYYKNDIRTYTSTDNGAGEIVIDQVNNDSYYGSFRFRAGDPGSDRDLVFTKGIIYDVPIYEPIIDTIEDQPLAATTFSCNINNFPLDVQVTSSEQVGSNVVGYGSTRTVIVRIIFPRNVEPGTYSLADITTSETYRAGYVANGIQLTVQSGTLVIESNNVAEKSVGGTFNFIATTNSGTQVSINNGIFGFNY